MQKSYESGPAVDDIVSRVCDADPDSIRQFYCDFLVPIAKAVIRSRGLRGVEPEELANIAFVHVCENNCRRLRTCNGQKPASWLWTIMYRLFLERVQDSSRSLPLDDQPESDFAAEDRTLDRLIREETKTRLLDTIQRLKSPRDRLAIRLRYLHELEYPSIASELGVPVATVHVIVSRAVKKLSNLLKGKAADADASRD